MRERFIIIALLFLPSLAHATVYSPTDCKYATVNAFVLGLVDGDTLVLPTCSGTIVGGDNTWTSTLTIGVNVILRGAGVGNTVLIDSVDRSNCGDHPLIYFDGHTNLTDNNAIQVTGMTIRGNAPDPGQCSEHLKITTGSHHLRVDHMTFGLASASVQSCSASSVTEVGTVATVVCSSPLGSQYVQNQYVQLAGFTPTTWNGHYQIATAAGSTFTFTAAAGLTSPPSVIGTISTDVQQTSTAMSLNGDEWGVVDHSTFNGVAKRGIFIRHFNWKAFGDWGDNSWAQPDTLGTTQEMYAEDNTFNITNAVSVGNVACEGGGRCVARHNTSPNGSISFVGTHGTDTGARSRSVRSFEVYNNTFNDLGSSIGQISQLRGGTALFYSNNMISTAGSYNGFNLQVYREANKFAPWGSVASGTNDGWKGACDGSGQFDTNDGVLYFSGTAAADGSSSTDHLVDPLANFTVPLNSGATVYSIKNTRTGTSAWGASIKTNTSTTIDSYAQTQSQAPHTWSANDPYEVRLVYPCADQVGRGAGTYISGGGNALPPAPTGSLGQAIDPVYAWLNTKSGTPTAFLTANFTHVQSNREYYDDVLGVGTGASGVGEGTHAQRPANCTTFAGFWETDTNKLFQCTVTGSPGTWTLYYTPLTYPHPFIAPLVVSPDLVFPTTTDGITSAALTTTFYNNSGGTVTTPNSQSITGANSGDFAISGTTCGASLADASTCTISVTFTPSAPGTRNAVLNIADSGAGSPHTANLTGVGQAAAAPVVTFSPTTFNFGPQLIFIGAPTVITLTNTGTAGLVISGIAFNGTNSGDFSETDTCPGTLAANANCLITVTFKAAAAGARSGALNVTDNAAGSPQSVPLTGQGFNWIVTGTGTISGQGSFQALSIPPPCLQGTILVHASTSCFLNGNVIIVYPVANSLYNPGGTDCTITGTGPTCPTQSDYIINPDCSVGGPLPGCQPATHGVNATRLIIANGGEYVFSCATTCEMDIALHDTFSLSTQAGPRLNKVGGTGPFEIYADQTIDGSIVGSADCKKGSLCGSVTGGPPFVTDPACETSSPNFCVVIGTTANYGTGSHTEDTHLKFICSGAGNCTFQLGSLGNHNR